MISQLTNCCGNPRRCVQVVMPEENAESSNSWSPLPSTIATSAANRRTTEVVATSATKLTASSNLLTSCIYTLLQYCLHRVGVILGGYTKFFKYLCDYKHFKVINMVPIHLFYYESAYINKSWKLQKCGKMLN